MTTTISALTPELLTKYKSLDDILYGEFENLTEELFKCLWAQMKTLIGINFLTKEREINFIEYVFKYKLNFNDKEIIVKQKTFIDIYEEINIKNNCNYYLNCLRSNKYANFDIFTNSFMTYEILNEFLMNDFDFIRKFMFKNIKSNITQMKNHKMKKLAKYCFKFDYADFDKSEFIQLTPERLATFAADYAADYAAKYAPALPVPTPITIDAIAEYLKNNKLSTDDIKKIIENIFPEK